MSKKLSDDFKKRLVSTQSKEDVEKTFNAFMGPETQSTEVEGNDNPIFIKPPKTYTERKTNTTKTDFVLQTIGSTQKNNVIEDFFISKFNIKDDKNTLTADKEYELAENLFELVKHKKDLKLSSSKNALLRNSLKTEYKDYNSAIDLRNNLFYINYSVAGQSIKVPVNRYTGYISGTVLTLDSFYQSLCFLENTDTNTSEIEVCVKRKHNDELSKKRILSLVKEKTLSSSMSEDNKENCLHNLSNLADYIHEARKLAITQARKDNMIEAYSNTDGCKFTTTGALAGTTLYNFVSNSFSHQLTEREEVLLNDTLNTFYKQKDLKCDRNNNITLEYKINDEVNSIKVNQYTGFVNGTLETLETFCKSLKVLAFSSDLNVNMDEIQDCVNKKNSDEFIKLRILANTSNKLFYSNMSFENQQKCLDNFNYLIDFVNIEKTRELEKAQKDNINIKTSAFNSRSARLNEIELLKSTFDFTRQEAFPNVNYSNIEDLVLSNEITSNLTEALNNKENTMKTKQTRKTKKEASASKETQSANLLQSITPVHKTNSALNER